ncbi:hypothetical protein FKM82_020970 [Ascaphus truei]
MQFSSLQGQLVTKDYPTHALVVIGLLVAASISCIPLGAVVTFIYNRLKRTTNCNAEVKRDPLATVGQVSRE